MTNETVILITHCLYLREQNPEDQHQKNPDMMSLYVCQVAVVLLLKQKILFLFDNNYGIFVVLKLLQELTAHNWQK